MSTPALDSGNRRGRRLNVALGLVLMGIVLVPVWFIRPDPFEGEYRHFRWPDARAIPQDDTGVIVYWRWSRPPSWTCFFDSGEAADPMPESVTVELMRWVSAVLPAAAGLLVLVGARLRGRTHVIVLLLAGSALVTMPLWAGSGIEFGTLDWWERAVWLPQRDFHEHYWGFWWPFGMDKLPLAPMALTVGGHRAAAQAEDPRIRRAAAVVFGLPLLLLLAREVLLLAGNFGWDCLWSAYCPAGQEPWLNEVVSPALLVGLWASMLAAGALGLINAWAGTRGIGRAGFAVGLTALAIGAAMALSCAFQGGLLALADHPVVDPFLDQGYLLHADLPFAIGLVFLASGFTRLCHLQAGRGADADSADQHEG